MHHSAGSLQVEVKHHITKSEARKRRTYDGQVGVCLVDAHNKADILLHGMQAVVDVERLLAHIREGLRVRLTDIKLDFHDSDGHK